MNIKVIKNEENPESTELLAASITKVADGFAKLIQSGLNERAYIVLLHAYIGQANISKRQIELVLRALPRLKGWYLK